MKLSGWGRYPVTEASVLAPRSVESLAHLVRAAPTLIARGNGRAYGDSAVNSAATVHTRHLNRMLAFNAESGELMAEPGVLMGDIIAAFLPRGWFPLVSPGTKFVTLGGAIAADVHGKNHHRDGSFRNCVRWVEVMGPEGEVVRCSATENAALFDHTLGGMGLTGIITRAAIRLKPVPSAWIRQTTHMATNLAAAMEVFEAHHDATYSVAWIDCLARGRDMGRSVVTLGEHASAEDLPRAAKLQPFITPAKRLRRVHFDCPTFVLNRPSVRAFNTLYYHAGARRREQQLVDWDSYFYPLDAILGWNRIYGRKGFMQFQCVLPMARAEAGLTALLAAVARGRGTSFLAVLKRFGAQKSAFSFPMEGYTLALDFPVNGANLRLMDRLDAVTLEHGGRFYLAKDSRMTAETCAASDSRVSLFQARRAHEGWCRKFISVQSDRLGL